MTHRLRPGRFLAIGAALLGWASCNARAARGDEPPERLIVATWNMEWFFDDRPDDNQSDLAKQMSPPNREDWEWRLQSAARVIGGIQPTILAVQEVEDRDALYALCRLLEEQDNLRYRIAYIPGFDFGTEQQVAILYRSGLVEYSRREQSQEMYESREYYNLPKHMFARFEWGQGDDLESLVVTTVHWRATPESTDIRQKQARLLRHWLDADLKQGENVIALGDFNSEHAPGQEPLGSEMQLLCWPAADSPALFDVSRKLPADLQATHLSDRAFDRILISQSLINNDPQRKDYVFDSVHNRRDLVIQGEKDIDHRDQYYQIDPAERDASDHYPLVGEFRLQ